MKTLLIALAVVGLAACSTLETLPEVTEEPTNMSLITTTPNGVLLRVNDINLTLRPYTCGTNVEAFKSILEKFDLVEAVSGVTAENTVVTIYINVTNKKFMSVEVFSDGAICLASTGDNLEVSRHTQLESSL